MRPDPQDTISLRFFWASAGGSEMSHRPPPLPLSKPERRRLAELEAVVERAWPYWEGVEFIDALAETRDAHLYRRRHPSFKTYLMYRWGLAEMPRRRRER